MGQSDPVRDRDGAFVSQRSPRPSDRILSTDQVPHSETDTHLTMRVSNETERYVNHRVSTFDSLLYISPCGRHRPWHGAGNDHKPHSRADLRRLAVRNAGARRT